jgi:uncharacterized membrane protein YdjX (TVP38/TMEM64 family)
VAYVLATVLMLPMSVFTAGGGILYGPLWATLIVILASNVGAACAFLIGRTVARGWVAKKVQGNRKFAAIDEAVGKQGFKIVLLTRLSPVFPFNLLNYSFGLTKVGFWTCVLASFIGMLPGTFMYVYFGSAIRSLADLAGGQTVQTGIAGKILFWAGLALAVVVSLLVARVAKKAISSGAAACLHPDDPACPDAPAAVRSE